jgi:IS5 family transposase
MPDSYQHGTGLSVEVLDVLDIVANDTIEEQKANNREKSKTRVRVEHVFGFMEQSMKGLIVRSVGKTRASGIIGLTNLTYKLFRYEQVMRLNILITK